MSKLRQMAQATTTVTTTVKLSPKVRAMVKERAEEDGKLGVEIAEREGRRKRIKVEVEELFIKEKQGPALMNGTELDGIKFKTVCGKRKVFDQEGFMKKHGLGADDFEEFTTEEPNEPYLKITQPGKR